MKKKKILLGTAIMALGSIFVLTSCKNTGDVTTGNTPTTVVTTNQTTTNVHTHNWDVENISWNWTGYTSATATINCKGAEHPEVLNATISSEITKEPKCGVKGTKTYTAKVTFNGAEYKNTKTEDITALEHKWTNPQIVKYPSINEEGEIKYTCSECNETKIEKINKVEDQTNYTLDATLMNGLTGVYTTKARVGDNKNDTTNPTTIGIPSVAKQNLGNTPTYESPAIIQGAAVNYETKTGPTEYTPIDGKELLAPYSYFRWKVTNEKLTSADGTVSYHPKLSGFDGSYYIIRIDVSDIIKGKTGYLHMRQEKNRALLVATGVQGAVDTGLPATDANNNATQAPTLKDGYWYNGDTNLGIPFDPNTEVEQAFAGANGNWFVGGKGFVDLNGTKSQAYSIENNGEALKDSSGNYMETPYIDVIVMSSSKLAAGADTGNANAPTSDIGISFYVDNTFDYNPSLKYDPASTDVNHETNVANKFFDETKFTEDNNASSYTIMGSDLEIDVVVNEDTDDYNEYWSLTKAISFQDYDSHTIKLICEVPVLEGLEVKSLDDTERLVILDLNSYDIQIANHNETNAAALTVSDNATLTIMDNSRTSGAELAIGNNARMLIKNTGTFIIDSSCQLEVEYDAASTAVPLTSTLADVIAKIEALPDPSVVNETNRLEVQEAENYYKVLDDAEKPNVTNYEKLQQCLEKLGPETPLSNGLIEIEAGGKIINNGIVNIEGLEVKPTQPSATDPNIVVVRDLKSAALMIDEGATFDNYGCMSIKGTLYVLGTLNNYGKYEDIIKGNDPDKGVVDYHKGIQLTWKDDVTVLKEGTTNEYTINPDVKPGEISLGLDQDNNQYNSAAINNYGDIILIPGVIKGYGTFVNLTEENKVGKLYVCSVSEAVVPINPDPADPSKIEERRQFSPAYDSTFDKTNITITGGNTFTADIEIKGNGLFGEMTNISEKQL